MSLETVFPLNILKELETSVKQYMDDHDVVNRPLRPSDASLAVGIFLTSDVPNQQDAQIGQLEPVTKRYTIRMQTLVASTDEEDGRAQAALSSKTLQAVLYRDAGLHVRLRELTEDLLGTRERVQRFGSSGTRYLNNELGGKFLYVSGTDFWVETELTQLSP